MKKFLSRFCPNLRRKLPQADIRRKVSAETNVKSVEKEQRGRREPAAHFVTNL
jgi:hypothetical protein